MLNVEGPLRAGTARGWSLAGLQTGAGLALTPGQWGRAARQTGHWEGGGDVVAVIAHAAVHATAGGKQEDVG